MDFSPTAGGIWSAISRWYWIKNLSHRSYKIGSTAVQSRSNRKAPSSGGGANCRQLPPIKQTNTIFGASLSRLFCACTLARVIKNYSITACCGRFAAHTRHAAHDWVIHLFADNCLFWPEKPASANFCPPAEVAVRALFPCPPHEYAKCALDGFCTWVIFIACHRRPVGAVLLARCKRQEKSHHCRSTKRVWSPKSG